MKGDLGKPLSSIFMEWQKSYKDMFEKDKQEIHADVVHRSKELETHLQVPSATLVEWARNGLLRQSTNVQGFLDKSSALFSSRVTQALDVGKNSGKISSAGAKKTKKRREGSVQTVQRNRLKVRQGVLIMLILTLIKRM